MPRPTGRQRHPQAPPVDSADMGPIEAGVTADLQDLTEPGTAALKATAIRLARALDGDAGLATAAVARELRATLAALTREESDDDGFDDLIARLSSPLQ